MCVCVQTATHDKLGERIKFFTADGEDYDVNELAQRERMGLDADYDEEFARMAAKDAAKATDDYDVDDMFVDRAAKGINRTKQAQRDRQRAINGTAGGGGKGDCVWCACGVCACLFPSGFVFGHCLLLSVQCNHCLRALLFCCWHRSLPPRGEGHVQLRAVSRYPTLPQESRHPRRLKGRGTARHRKRKGVCV